MYKSIFALLIVGLLLAGPVLADPPPDGWGNDPTEWIEYSGSCYKEALFIPVYCNYEYAGEWNVYRGNDPFCCQIDIELWVEMNAIMTYDYTVFMFHRLGTHAETVNGFIVGSMSSNHPQCMHLMAGDGFDMFHLQFQHDIWGHDDGQGGQEDIPLNWGYAWGGNVQNPDPPDDYDVDPSYRGSGSGNQLYLPPYEDDYGIYFCIDFPCYHWFIWWFWFYLRYHFWPGYWALYFAGCPVPVL